MQVYGSSLWFWSCSADLEFSEHCFIRGSFKSRNSLMPWAWGKDTFFCTRRRRRRWWWPVNFTSHWLQFCWQMEIGGCSSAWWWLYHPTYTTYLLSRQHIHKTTTTAFYSVPFLASIIQEGFWNSYARDVMAAVASVLGSSAPMHLEIANSLVHEVLLGEFRGLLLSEHIYTISLGLFLWRLSVPWRFVRQFVKMVNYFPFSILSFFFEI